MGRVDPNSNGDPFWHVNVGVLLLLAVLSWAALALLGYGAWLIVRVLTR